MIDFSFDDKIPFEQTLSDTATRFRAASNEINKARVNNKSIVTRAKKSIFNFPIFISQSIRINEAHIISKMFERVYATFVQTVIAQNQRVSEDEFNDLEFLKKIHTNLDRDLAESTDIPAGYNIYYKPIDFTDECLHDSLYKKIKLTENVSVIFKGIDPRGRHYDLAAMHQRLINEPLKGFSYLSEDVAHKGSRSTERKSGDYLDMDGQIKIIAKNTGNVNGINLYKKFKGADEISAKDAGFGVFEDLRSMGHDAYIGSKGNIYYKIGKNKYTNKYDVLTPQQLSDIFSALDDKHSLPGDVLKDRNGKWMYKGRIETTKDMSYEDPQFGKWGNLSADYGSAPKLLRDSDIKKINGMLPYTIEAKIMVKNFKGLAGDSGISIVIGVKSILHIIQPKDLGDDIKDIILGNIKKIQKVRYTTGEITFKDYLFGMTGAKKAAAQTYKGKKKWLSVLKRLGDYSKMYSSALKDPVMALNKGVVPIPNATMVLTSLDVENIKSNSGVDLNKVSVVRILAKQLFLICFVIVDSSAGKMKVLYPESDTDWDVQSLASVETDLAKTDNSELVKELNRVVNR